MKTATLMSNTLTIEGGTKEHNVRLTYTNYKGNSIVDNRNPVNTYVHMARSTSLEELKHYKDESGKETPPIGPTL